MKKFTVLFLTVLLSLSLVSVYATTEIKPSAPLTANTTEKAASKVLISRLNEIKELDKSNMTSSDKKALRTEVKTIKKQLKEYRGGIYLSLGAVIIIVLLLIILL